VVTNGSYPVTGRVLQVNLSGGGVPKKPVDSAWVGRFGLRGDAHDEFTVHGGPHQAVCLFAIEAIERLRSEGHPVHPGSVGENLTTTGVEWSLLPVGTRARVGETLELELASAAMPCKTQTHNFVDGRFSRMSIDLYPSDSRMYARVLSEGEVRPGDEITVLPPAAESRAEDEQLLDRLDRVEAKSIIAAWKAAANAGFNVTIVEDGDISMAASTDIPGPAYNHAAGLARYPNLLDMVTDFYDKQGSVGWLIAEHEPWPDAQINVVVDVYAARPEDVRHVPTPPGVSIRPLHADEVHVVERLYQAAGSGGLRASESPNPWPAVYAALTRHPHRVVLIAEEDRVPIAIASLHTNGKAGWLRGAEVVPAARNRGIQKALIAARARIASERGCDLVGSCAKPGEVSATNIDRMGMRRIGTRTHYVYVPPGVAPPPPPE
jgi:MOSC domain-containing protein YiiM/GNAT superfamily N-acetyltransferase